MFVIVCARLSVRDSAPSSSTYSRVRRIVCTSCCGWRASDVTLQRTPSITAKAVANDCYSVYIDILYI
jgi:hypothetical protein